MRDEQRDVIDILTTDHREMEAMFTELETLLETRRHSDDELRKDLVDQITIELVRHAVAEESPSIPRSGRTSARRRRSAPSASAPRPSRP